MDTPVAVVTGASRGAGRGIAAALLAAGWKVYVTGRTVTDPGPGGVAVPVDHSDDVAVGALFRRVADESGRLDLLVNNAAAIHDALVDPKPFWEKPIELADVLDVGLRSAYVASWHAAPLLLAGDKGLIAFTSSPGSVCYMHGPTYKRENRKQKTEQHRGESDDVRVRHDQRTRDGPGCARPHIDRGHKP